MAARPVNKGAISATPFPRAKQDYSSLVREMTASVGINVNTSVRVMFLIPQTSRSSRERHVANCGQRARHQTCLGVGRRRIHRRERRRCRGAAKEAASSR